jgi:predicted nucleic acid-binding protein
MKIDFIADTNFLIYIHEGNVSTRPFLKYNFGISFISEIELLGYTGISISEEIKLKSIIQNCFQTNWNNLMIDQTIQLKRNYQIKLPDAIIAATSITNKVPLISADKGFSKIKELDLVLLEL